MSTTMESKSASDTREHPHNSRVSSFDVRPSVAGMIADSDGNLDEKKAVAALSQTREQNKHMWIGCFVLIGVVFILIAANIGTSVAVARLTRPLNIDPVTGMATIAGSDEVVMKTSIARYSEEDLNFHSVPTEYLSTVEKVDFADGNLSFDVKGYARMSNETILLIEGGALIFNIIGLKNITGDAPTQMMLSVAADINNDDESLLTNDENTLNYSSTVDENDGTGSSAEEGVRRLSGRPRRTPRGYEDLHSVDSIDMASNNPTRKLQSCENFKGDPIISIRCQNMRAIAAGTMRIAPRCGPSHSSAECPEDLQYCNEATGYCGQEAIFRDAQPSITYDWTDPNAPCTYYDEQSAAILPCAAPYVRQVGCGRLKSQGGGGTASCPEDLPYCNNRSGWCSDTRRSPPCFNIHCARYYDWKCSNSNPDRLVPHNTICNHSYP